MSSTDVVDEKQARAGRRFLELIADGVGPISAGIEVGWSPAKTKRMMKDTEFAELVSFAQDQTIESVEKAMVDQAKKGNVRAGQFFLLNRAPDRWRDVKHIQVDQNTQLDVGVIVGVKEGVLEALRAGGIKSLQPARDVIEADVVDGD